MVPTEYKKSRFAGVCPPSISFPPVFIGAFLVSNLRAFAVDNKFDSRKQKNLKTMSNHKKTNMHMCRRTKETILRGACCTKLL